MHIDVGRYGCNLLLLHCDLSCDRVESLVKDLREYLVLEDVPIVPLSALNGENIGQLKDNLMQFISTFNKLSETNTESKFTTVKDTEAIVSTEAEKSGGGALFGYKASGTLTNQWSSQKDGQVFHVILRKGTVCRHIHSDSMLFNIAYSFFHIILFYGS